MGFNLNNFRDTLAQLPGIERRGHITGAARMDDPLWGYTQAEVDEWRKANGRVYSDTNSGKGGAQMQDKDYWDRSWALEMALENDPEFKQVWDSRPRKSFGDHISGMANGFVDGVGNFVEGLAPVAAVAYGGNLIGNALAGGATTPTIGAAAPAAEGLSIGGGGGLGLGEASGLALSDGLAPAAANTITGATAVPALNALTNIGASTIPGSTLPDVNLSGGTPDLSGFDWTDAAIIGSGLYSDYQSGESHDAATEEISRQFDINQENLAPWQEAGVNALDKLTNFDTDSITNDPMYQHQLGEALRGTERGASARGFNLSTNALNDIAQTSANQSSNWGNNLWNRQAGLAGVGQAATNTGIDLGTNTANTLAGFDLSRGSDRNNAVQGTLSNWLTRDYTQNPPGNPWKEFYDMWRP